MDQFQGCGLVDGVGVSPVDANLEGFLRDSSERGRRVRKSKCGNCSGNEDERKSISVLSHCRRWDETVH